MVWACTKNGYGAIEAISSITAHVKILKKVVWSKKFCALEIFEEPNSMDNHAFIRRPGITSRDLGDSTCVWCVNFDGVLLTQTPCIRIKLLFEIKITTANQVLPVSDNLPHMIYLEGQIKCFQFVQFEKARHDVIREGQIPTQ